MVRGLPSVDLLTRPGGHGAHAVSLACTRFPGQLTQTPAAAIWLEPHAVVAGTQVALTEAPAGTRTVPSAHGTQADPSSFDSWPGGHGAHVPLRPSWAEPHTADAGPQIALIEPLLGARTVVPGHTAHAVRSALGTCQRGHVAQ